MSNEIELQAYECPTLITEHGAIIISFGSINIAPV
jgi:hypothetical protein